MKEKKKLWLMLIALVAILGGAVLVYQKMAPQKTNSSQKQEEVAAIDFNVQNKDGKNTYLSDFYDEKPIILNFWTSKCGPCQMEMPDFQELYDKYQDQVHFVMIDCIGAMGETKEAGKAFIENMGYTFPVYYDVNQNAQSAYGVRAFPTTYIISQEIVQIGGSGMIDYDVVDEVLQDMLVTEKKAD